MTPAVFAALLSAICWVESGHNPKAVNWHDGKSPSYGECQIKYSTAHMLGYRGPITKLWLDRDTNRLWAGKYLQHQIDKYGNVWTGVAAYNCGYDCKRVTYVHKVYQAMEQEPWRKRR